MGKIIDIMNYANAIDVYLFEYRIKLTYYKLIFHLKMNGIKFLLDFFTPIIENDEHWFMIGWLWFQFTIYKKED